MTTVLEALKSARFVVDASGQRVAVQVSPVLWEALLAWLEHEEHMPTVEELTSRAKVASIAEDRALVAAAMKLSEASLHSVWNNPEDDVYNEL